MQQTDLVARRAALVEEQAKAQQALAQVDTQRQQLIEVSWRLAGAVALIDELLAQERTAAHATPDGARTS